jgi:hypothetical protein
MLRAAIFGASAIAGVLAARRSTQSRRDAETREEFTYEAHADPGSATVAWQHPVHTPATAQADLAAADSHAPDGSPVRDAELLLWQAAASILLIALAPLLRPSGIGEAVWMQLVALVCLAALAVPLCLNLLGRAAARRLAAQAAADAAASAASAAGDVTSLQALRGVWVKDKEASDSLDAPCDLAHIGGLVRVAIGLIKGVDISVSPGQQFRFSVLSTIGWFKITESYSLEGGAAAAEAEARHRRRDLRGGGSFGSAEAAAGGGVRVRNRWNEPHAGTLDERFYCPEPGVMHVDAVMVVGERRVEYRQIYRRKQ